MTSSFLDGCKNWSTDGLAVILAERLLRPGGWLLLDDLGWSYGKNAQGAQHYGIHIAKLSDEERDQPHLRAIFDMLIKTNPAFDEFLIQDDWWARKSPDLSLHVRTGGVLSGTATSGEDRPSHPLDESPRVWQHVARAARQRLSYPRSRADGR